jgi:hypothetical protein
MRDLKHGDTLFEVDDEWALKAEVPGNAGIQSYIYHKLCGGPHTDSDGWCSAWDVREGCCYYCKKAIPEEISFVWLMMEGHHLGTYMLDKERPWNPPGRPS